MRHREVKIFSRSCEQVFAVVADVERYPEFLPGWSEVRILRSESDRLEVEQRLRLALLRIRFCSVARLECCRQIFIESRDAPFGNMTIRWQFEPQGEGRCRVCVEIGLDLRAGPLKGPLQSFLRGRCSTLLHLFEERLEKLYGHDGR